MAVYRSLRTLISRNSNNKLSRTFLTLFLSPPTLFPFFSPAPRSRFLSPHSKWIIPFRGPLFLSSPPWKLSQSATPIYVQSDVILLPKVQAWNLLQSRSLPINLGFASASPVQEFLNRTVVKEFGDGGVGAGRGGLAEGFVNLPNLISMSRLISGPFLGWMILQEMYLPAFVGLAISGATDWLDGYMARKMEINSVIGSYLDPLADKVLIGSVALAMVEMSLLHPGLVGLVVLRDVALVGGAVYKRASCLNWEWKSWYDFFDFDGTQPEKVEPLFLSKVNTVFQLVLVAAALLQPEFGIPETQAYINYLSWLVASTTIASTAAYGAQHLRSGSTILKRNQ